MPQETHSNFLEFFVRRLKCTGVQVARTEVSIAKNSRKPKETQSPRLHSPNPRGLMDPDL